MVAKSEEAQNVYELISSYMHNMNERIGSHAQEMRNAMSVMDAKMDSNNAAMLKQMRDDKEDLLDRINIVNVNSIEKNHKVELKVTSIAAVVTVIVSMVAEAFKGLFHK